MASGGPDTANLGVLLRAAYTIGREAFYLRPNLTLGVVHVRTGSYREDGAGHLNLAVDSASQTVLSVTPLLEVGGRLGLGHGRVLRPYLSAGLSIQNADAWTRSGRLTSAPTGASGFTTRVQMDQVIGRLAAGVQLYSGRH